MVGAESIPVPEKKSAVLQGSYARQTLFVLQGLRQSKVYAFIAIADYSVPSAKGAPAPPQLALATETFTKAREQIWHLVASKPLLRPAATTLLHASPMRSLGHGQIGVKASLHAADDPGIKRGQLTAPRIAESSACANFNTSEADKNSTVRSRDRWDVNRDGLEGVRNIGQVSMQRGSGFSTMPKPTGPDQEEERCPRSATPWSAR